MRKKWAAFALGLMCTMICWGCGAAPGSETVSDPETEQTTVAADRETEQTESISEASDEKETESITETDETAAGSTEEGEETGWSPSSLRNGLTTSIEYDKRYNAVVGSAEDALKIVKMYGDMQKETYDNPAVSAIEAQMETEFDIAYVALGEIDEATAQDIYTAFQYMYQTYPQLQGTLTDFTLGNITWNAMAQTRTYEFVTNYEQVPIVLKREIIINAASFLNREALLSSCSYNEETGFWPSNTSVSMIIVHELGHHLLDVHNSSLHGFSGNYVTEETNDAYRAYAQEGLAWSQEEVKRIMAAAYEKWATDHQGSEEDFRGSISGYAKGIQDDGGISYTETFAEAVADIYANGENAAQASKLIVEAMYEGEQ